MKFGIIGVGMPDIGEGYSYDNSYMDLDQNGNDFEYVYINEVSRESGFFFKAGPKFMRNRDNSLEGWYLKPELVYSRILAHGRSVETDPYYQENNHDYTWNFVGNSAGVLVNFGYQSLFAERFSFDVNLGIGYTHQFDNFKTKGDAPQHDWMFNRYENSNNSSIFRYSHTQVDGAAITMGIALGVLLK